MKLLICKGERIFVRVIRCDTLKFNGIIILLLSLYVLVCVCSWCAAQAAAFLSSKVTGNRLSSDCASGSLLPEVLVSVPVSSE